MSFHMIPTYQKSPIAVVITIIAMLAAGYLCWNCNSGEKTGTRVIYTVFSVIFSWIYLIYYLIRRVLMKRECNKTN